MAAWLPGTSGGQGVLDAITGDYVFRANGQNDRRNTLSMDWPKTMVLLFLFRTLSATSPFMILMDKFPKLLTLCSKLDMASQLLLNNKFLSSNDIL